VDIVKGVLEEELRSSIHKRERYLSLIHSLPKGKLSKRKIGRRDYLYLLHREGSRVKNDYVGIPDRDRDKIEKLSGEINQRKSYEKALRDLNKKIKYLEKLLNVKSV